MSAKTYTPILLFHHSSWVFCLAACLGLVGNTSFMYLSTKSPKVCFLASAVLKWRPFGVLNPFLSVCLAIVAQLAPQLKVKLCYQRECCCISKQTLLGRLVLMVLRTKTHDSGEWYKAFQMTQRLQENDTLSLSPLPHHLNPRKLPLAHLINMLRTRCH